MARPKSPKSKNNEVVTTTSNVSATVESPAPTVSAPVQAETRSRKMGVVKTESRATLIPINLEDEIRRLAYELSERRGFEAGHENEDWLNAEREVLQRYHQQSA